MQLSAYLTTSILLLAGCGGEDDDGSGGAGSSGGNAALTISGSPATSTLVERVYSFTPTANDGNGDVLTFSIVNRPEWAEFSTSTGRLRGTPPESSLGAFADIAISVTDGAANASLAPFSIAVVPTAAGTATLSWAPPMQNTDGSPLTNLGGYRIYFGTENGEYPNAVTIDNPGLTTYMIEQLTPATWFFVTTALNAQGIESPLSNAASKTVQ